MVIGTKYESSLYPPPRSRNRSLPKHTGSPDQTLSIGKGSLLVRRADTTQWVLGHALSPNCSLGLVRTQACSLMNDKSNSNTACVDITVYSQLCAVHTHKHPIKCFADLKQRKLGAGLGWVFTSFSWFIFI